MRRLIGLLAIAGGAVLLAPAGASAEIIYPWCAMYPGGQEGIGSTICSFVSRQQCMATVQGMGGMCMENPAYPGPAPRPYGKRPHRYPAR